MYKGKDYRFWTHDQARVWGIVLTFACFLGKVLEFTVIDGEIKAVLKNLQWMTGPRVYFDYFWAYFGMFKCMSCCFSYSFGKFGSKYWAHALVDLVIILAFFGLHEISYLLQSETGFKVSGHCLILSVSLQLLNKESYFSVKSTNLHFIHYFSTIFISIHYFFLFWTCLAYHTFLEALIGSLTGFLYPAHIIQFLIPS